MEVFVGIIKRMLNILHMWLMVCYFQKRQKHLHYNIDGIFEDAKYNENSIVGRALEAHSEEEKILVPKSTLKIHFVLFYYLEYWFENQDKSGGFLKRHLNHADHIRFANKIMIDCIQSKFFKLSEKNTVYICITKESEQFSTFPLGLLREWIIYLKPLMSITITSLVFGLYHSTTTIIIPWLANKCIVFNFCHV